MDSISVSNQYLRFVITPTAANQAILQELQEEIDLALQAILLNPDYADLQAAYQNDPLDTRLTRCLKWTHTGTASRFIFIQH